MHEQVPTPEAGTQQGVAEELWLLREKLLTDRDGFLFTGSSRLF